MKNFITFTFGVLIHISLATSVQAQGLTKICTQTKGAIHFADSIDKAKYLVIREEKQTITHLEVCEKGKTLWTDTIVDGKFHAAVVRSSDILLFGFSVKPKITFGKGQAGETTIIAGQGFRTDYLARYQKDGKFVSVDILPQNGFSYIRATSAGGERFVMSRGFYQSRHSYAEATKTDIELYSDIGKLSGTVSIDGGTVTEVQYYQDKARAKEYVTVKGFYNKEVTFAKGTAEEESFKSPTGPRFSQKFVARFDATNGKYLGSVVAQRFESIHGDQSSFFAVADYYEITVYDADFKEVKKYALQEFFEDLKFIDKTDQIVVLTRDGVYQTHTSGLTPIFIIPTAEDGRSLILESSNQITFGTMEIITRPSRSHPGDVTARVRSIDFQGKTLSTKKIKPALYEWNSETPEVFKSTQGEALATTRADLLY